MSEHTAIVTGGSTGIGRAICAAYLEQGYQVINLSRRPLEMDSPDLHNVEVDLSDRKATHAAAADVCARFEVDTLVHNAGVIRPALIEEVELEDLDYLADIHLGAGIILLQACLPTMKAKSHGRVVLMSTRAVQGLETRTNYSATKAAMVAQVRTWALELGQYGIAVNAVAPGPIQDTEMFEEVFSKGDPRVDTLAGSLPLRRLGRPEDVARAVLFLGTEDNRFITGQCLFVCGGGSLGGLALP